MSNALDYAPRQKWYRRRRVWRAAVWVVTLVVIGGTFYWGGPVAYRRGRILYWQHRCMVHVDPPGMVVGEVTVNPTAGLDRDYKAVCEDSKGLRYSIESWTSGGWITGESAVFLHARKCAAGERLVVMEFRCSEVGTSPNAYVSALAVWVLQPGSLTEDPRAISAGVWQDLGSEWLTMLTGGQTLRVLAGECDPADEAGILVPFERDGVRHVARFKLNATGDDVERVVIVPPM